MIDHGIDHSPDDCRAQFLHLLCRDAPTVRAAPTPAQDVPAAAVLPKLQKLRDQSANLAAQAKEAAAIKASKPQRKRPPSDINGPKQKALRRRVPLGVGAGATSAADAVAAAASGLGGAASVASAAIAGDAQAVIDACVNHLAATTALHTALYKLLNHGGIAYQKQQQQQQDGVQQHQDGLQQQQDGVQ